MHTYIDPQTLNGQSQFDRTRGHAYFFSACHTPEQIVTSLDLHVLRPVPLYEDGGDPFVPQATLRFFPEGFTPQMQESHRFHLPFSRSFGPQGVRLREETFYRDAQHVAKLWNRRLNALQVNLNPLGLGWYEILIDDAEYGEVLAFEAGIEWNEQNEYGKSLDEETESPILWLKTRRADMVLFGDTPFLQDSQLFVYLTECARGHRNFVTKGRTVKTFHDRFGEARKRGQTRARTLLERMRENHRRPLAGASQRTLRVASRGHG